MKDQVYWACSALILVFLFSQKALAKNQSELRIFSLDIPKNLDYNNSHKSWEDYINANLAEGLLSAGKKGELIPGQAESWSVSDDGLEYLFKLREDSYWSDGKPVIAEDFVMAWHRIVDPNRENRNKAFLHPLKNYKEVSSGKRPIDHLGVTAINPKTLLVRLSAPTGHFLKMLQPFKLSPVPSHYSHQQIDQMMLSSTGDLVVNGPYKVKSKSKDEIRLSKNTYYWDAERIFYQYLKFTKPENSNGKAAVRSVLTGEVDLSLHRNQEALQWIEESYPEYLLEIPILFTEHYVLNASKNMLTQHADVREALSMVIDRDKISNKIMKGSATPTYNYAPPSLFSFHPPETPEWAKWAYNERLKKASEILQKRGITPETPVNISLKTQTRHRRHQVAMAIKSSWRKIGVNVNIITSSAPETYQQIERGDYQIARAALVGDYPDPYDFLYVLGSGSPLFTGMARDSEIDKLLAKSMSVIDPEEREKIFKRIEEINHKLNLLIPLYNPRQYLLKSPRIQGVGQAAFITSMRWARPID